MLELTDLSRRFGDVVALDSVSFSVAEGQIVGFVGPNGAGKTTAMRIALGVLEPDRGEVRWRGKPVDQSVRRRFGYLPEERGLYPKMRVLDQLVYLARLHGLARGEAATEALRMLDVLGVAGRARDRTDALSLGNQQRVQLAAGLISDLRSRDHRRLVRVEVLGAAPGWYATIPGARVLDHFPDGAILELSDSLRERDLLDAARAAGDVRHFSVVQPSLSEIFREAVRS